MTTTYEQGMPNYAEDVNMLYSELSTSYLPIIDLGLRAVNTQFIFVNETDVDITMKFSTSGNSTTFLIHAGKKLEMSKYRHHGLVECKLNSSASSGLIKFITWK